MIFLILLLGLVLRIINLNQSLWLDEAISALAVKNNSFVGLITNFAKGDTHPPLYYLILKLWSGVIGYSEISLRLPSVIFGTITIFIVYLISKHYLNRTYALIASFLMATAPLHIYYSQEVRMYALSSFLVGVCFYFFIKKTWVRFSISLLALGMTDYLPLLIIPVFAINILINNRMAIKSFILAQIPLYLFLILWSPIFLIQGFGTKNFLNSFPQWGDILGKAGIKDLVLVWTKFIIGRISIEPKLVYAIVVSFISIPLAFLLLRRSSNFRKYSVIWSWLLIPLILAFLGSLFVPGFSYFRLLFILPAFYILISLGIIGLKYSKLIVFTIICLNMLFSSAYIFNSNFWREDWRNAVNFIENKIQLKEIVLMSFPEPFAPYRWYAKEITKTSVAKDSWTIEVDGVYTFDYLMDLTDPSRDLFKRLELDNFKEMEIYDFRGVGQIRYWRR